MKNIHKKNNYYINILWENKIIEKERYQELLDIGYTETQIKKILEKDELTKELYERLIEEKETSTTKDKTGHIKFKNVNHQERAEKFGRVSDGDTTEYLNIALKYFNYRCALSGEIFESFGKVNNTKAKSNLSAEHIVPLCQGGDDIAPNLVPSVLQYNISKNGYNLLDWWKKQKDNSGKELYSPYRLLKIVNFMMKSIEARKQGLNIKQYEKVILIPNEIDKILEEIEKQDKEIQENEKRKLISDTKTTTQIDEDGKKILQIIPELEGNIPKQSEQQQKERYEEIRMMDIFLTDAIITLKENKELEQYDTITKQLDEMYKNVVGTIPFEVEVRNKILSILEDFGIEENKCTVANELLRNTNILKELKSKGNNESSINDIDNYLNEQIGSLRKILTEEQIQIGISNIPEILYNKETRNKIEFYITKRPNHLDEYLKGNNFVVDEFIDTIIKLQEIKVDTTKLVSRDTIKSLAEKSGITEKQLIEVGLNPEDNIGISKTGIVQAYNGNGNYKPPTQEQVEELKILGISLEEKDIVQEFIDTIIKLQEIKVDTTKLVSRDTIKSLAEKSGITEKQLIEAGLKPENKIGINKSSIVQAYRGNGSCKPPTQEQVEELKTLGISLEKIEIDFVQEFIYTISKLQEIGVDSTKFFQTDTVKSLADKSGITEKQLIDAGLNPDDNIGRSKNRITLAYRGKGSYKPPTQEQVEELKILGISLEEKDTVQEFIDTINTLQEIGVDITRLTTIDTIKSLVEKSGITEKQLIKAGLNPSDKIGKTKKNISQAYRGKGNCKPPTQEQVEKLKILGISLEEKDTVQEFIDTVNKLQEIGVDTTKLINTDTIKSLAEKSGITEKELIEVGLNPRNNIGTSKNSIVKSYRGKIKCKPPTQEQVEELKNLGIALEEKDTVQEFIEKIKKLQGIGVDTTRLKTTDTIKSLAEKSGITEKQLIEVDLNPKDNIGGSKCSIAKSHRGTGQSKPPTQKQVEELKILGISLESKVKKSKFKKTIIEQKERQLLGENKEVKDEFEQTIRFTEHNLKYDEIEK